MHSNEITDKVAKGKYTFGTKNKDIRYKKPIGLKRTILKNSLLSMRKDGTKDSMVYISKNKSLLSKLIRSKSQLRKYSSLSNAEKKRNSAILNKQLEKKAISDLAGLTKEHLRNTVFVSGNTIGYTAPYAEKLYYSTGYKFQQAMVENKLVLK